MCSLSELQERFSRHLLQGDATPDAALSKSILPGIPDDVSLAIYRNNVHSRFIDALTDVFPAVRRIVGDEFFRATVRSYMTAYPSRIGTLIGVGREFAAFLGTFEPAGALPYLADVAKVEWLHRDAYHAADAVPVGLDQLHALASARTDVSELRLHPSVRLLSTEYPVLDVWEANRRDGEVPPMTLSGPGERLLIARPFADVVVLKLTEPVFALLCMLDGGSTLETAISAQGDMAAPSLNELANLFMAGVFTLSDQETKP